MSTPGRIPAHGLERIVLAELKAFLESPERVSNALAESSYDLSTTRRLIEWAQRAAKRVDFDPGDVVCEFLASIVDRIVIHTNSIEIHLRRSALRSSFLEPSHSPTNQSGAVTHREELIVLSAEARFRKCRGEMRLIIPSRTASSETSKPVPSLVKAISRAQDWVRAIIAGEYKDQRAIAEAIGVNERYVSHVIAGAFLAPRIVEAITNGHQHSAVNLAMLLDNTTSMSWKEQWARFARYSRNEHDLGSDG